MVGWGRGDIYMDGQDAQDGGKGLTPWLAGLTPRPPDRPKPHG